MNRFRPQTTGNKDVDRVIRQIVDEFNKGFSPSKPSASFVNISGVKEDFIPVLKKVQFSFDEFSSGGSSKLLHTVPQSFMLEAVYVSVETAFSEGAFISISDQTELVKADECDLTKINLYGYTIMKYYSLQQQLTLTMTGLPAEGSGLVFLKVTKVT